MDYDTCRQRAIKAGALKPRGMKERMWAGHLAHESGNINAFAQTPLAQSRLADWINDCLSGRPFSK